MNAEDFPREFSLDSFGEKETERKTEEPRRTESKVKTEIFIGQSKKGKMDKK